MKKEYIIINMTNILKRIEELEKLHQDSAKPSIQGIVYDKLITELKQILSQSVSLNEEIERAYRSAVNYGVYLQGGSYNHDDNIDYEDYMKNLKLDI